MNASHRPDSSKSIAKIKDPRAIAEEVARELPDKIPLPKRPLGEDLTEGVNRILRNHLHDPMDLGSCVEEDDQSHPAYIDRSGHIGGTPRPINFDAGWWEWFSKRTPEQRQALGRLARYLAADEKRQAALSEMINQHIEAGIVVKSRRKFYRTCAAIFGATWGVVVWGGDAAEWVIGKLPVVKTIIQMWRGPSP